MMSDTPQNSRDVLLHSGASVNRRVENLGLWFDRTPLLCAVGDTTHLRQVNLGWEHALGWNQVEILSLQWTSLIHPHDLDQTIEACRATRLPLMNFPNRYLRKDGEYIWVRWFMDFPSDMGFFYSCGIPSPENESLLRIAEHRADVFKATYS